MTPYGNLDLGQHWLRKWLVAWWHQANTWTNVQWGLVVISQEMLKISILDTSLKIGNLRFQPHLPGVSELMSSEIFFVKPTSMQARKYLVQAQSISSLLMS